MAYDRRLRHQQVSFICLWTTLCVGDRQLGHQSCCNPTSADAPDVLGRGHRASPRHGACGRTGQDSASILNSTPSSKSISNSQARFANRIPHQQNYPCVPRTCPTTVGHISNPRVQMPTQCTSKAYSWISPFPLAGVILTSKMYLSILAICHGWSIRLQPHGDS